MKTVMISLNSIDKVKSFVNDISRFDYDFDLVSGRYVIDAKSIMGIFSLDLSKPIELNIHAGEGAEDVLFTTINGKPGMVFNRPGKNAVCAAILDEFGAVTEFRFFPASSEGFYFEAQMMICSIQPLS